MIRTYAAQLAGQLGIQLSDVSVVEGRTVGCLDTYLLHLVSRGQMVSVLVYQSELNALQGGCPGERLEMKVSNALRQLIALAES